MNIKQSTWETWFTIALFITITTILATFIGLSYWWIIPAVLHNLIAYVIGECSYYFEAIDNVEWEEDFEWEEANVIETIMNNK